ncbi:helix-turn-helix domain-containing protein [Actinoallomurus spadix]|uniref:Helix-turn-helix transcriptional regulator n=1 Tax=Actinoallomurus spadix TaxID=79912 RepID=A0ABN0WF55_9ACTN|nr:helix-turn-helix transcriptional regulator [Actinoallomurus spadix]MCO5987321.1 helix-turn-helix domain-containing protein [Actinoallomurus spadix]
MASVHSLSVRARRLATELKGLRESSGLSVEQAAAQLGWSYSKLNRFENGRAIPPPKTVAHIIDLYGVPDGKRDSLIRLARDAGERGWWEDLGVFTGSYVGLEDAASFIRSWQPLLIPGLLQTEDYARAVIRAGLPHLGSTGIEKRVKARIARQTLLSRPDAPEFHAIVGAAALRHEVGSAAVMREQLRKIEEIARKRSNVTIQVLPFTAGASIGLEGAFTHFEFVEAIDPAVSCIEDISGEKYVESAEGNRRIRLAFDRIGDAALTPEESAALLADMSKE